MLAQRTFAPSTPGTAPRLAVSGATCRIERSLGMGSQGEVFSVQVSGGGLSGRYALKWYHTPMATPQQRAALLALIEQGAPDERFLWPIDLAEIEGQRSFGYLMPLRPPEYHGILELVRGAPPWSARVLATVGQQLADSFLRLHALGLCYRDINFGNVFYRPDTGAVLVCDNDNVGINGASDAQVWGTPYFMAPEVVRQERLPDYWTDRHSLAVLLFYMTMRHHPLIGARAEQFPGLDHDEALNVLCGTDPRFIFDPDDASNRPIPDLHGPAIANWPMYPAFVRKRFEQAFVAGLQQRQSRVAEGLWRLTMTRLRDTVFACPGCGADLFAELPTTAGTRPSEIRCWNDGVAARPRFVLFAGHDVFHHPRTLAASLRTVLYDHHVESKPQQRPEHEPRVIGRIVGHPHDPQVWGLRNETNETWHATRKDGETLKVKPGRSVRLEDSLRIQIAAQEVIVTES